MPPKIMFVDDEIRILSALQRHLAAAGVRWRLSFESDPRAALRAAIDEAPDVVVCDMRMPGMDGIMLLQAMRKEGVDATAIMLTGSAEVKVAAAAINEAGVFRFFSKPCPTEMLVMGIEAALLERSKASDSASVRPDFKAFDLLSSGVFVLDEGGRTIYSNPEAGNMMERGRSILANGDGRLRLSEDGKPVDLAVLLEELRRTGEALQFGLLRKDALHPLAITLRLMEDRSHVALIATDPERVDPPKADVIARILKLTKSEAGLVHQLALGLSVSEAAEACDLSVQSARTYLKRIYQKTRTSRQSDLMRLVYSFFPGHLAGTRRALDA
jgi:FixJ family two-component response regulator